MLVEVPPANFRVPLIFAIAQPFNLNIDKCGLRKPSQTFIQLAWAWCVIFSADSHHMLNIIDSFNPTGMTSIIQFTRDTGPPVIQNLFHMKVTHTNKILGYLDRRIRDKWKISITMAVLKILSIEKT